METKNHILVVDDEQDLCEILKFNLETEGYEVDTANSAEEVLEIGAEKYDLLLLDVMLGAMSGFALAKKLKDEPMTANIPIIFLTARDTENDTVTGFNLGADDYISKPFGVLELIARIKANLRRRAYQQNELLTYKGIVIDDVRHEIRVNGNRIQATAKEYDLVRMLVKNHSAVLSRDRLLDEIWGENYGETRTLDMHITQARRIIRDSGAEIKTIRGIGYMLE